MNSSPNPQHQPNHGCGDHPREHFDTRCVGVRFAVRDVPIPELITDPNLSVAQ